MKPSFVRPLVTLVAGLLLVGPGLSPARAQTPDPFQSPEAQTPRPEATTEGQSAKTKGAPKEPERVVKSLEQWQKELPHAEFLVTRMKATEPAFSGKYATGHWKGTFLCVCCGAKLFDANHKFDSGTGWPSFDRPASNKALATAWDYSEPEARVEVTCRRCGAHLGHVFQDGPTATGLRFCINSLALKLDTERVAPPAAKKKSARSQTSRSTRRAPRPRASESDLPSAENPTKGTTPGL